MNNWILQMRVHRAIILCRICFISVELNLLGLIFFSLSFMLLELLNEALYWVCIVHFLDSSNRNVCIWKTNEVCNRKINGFQSFQFPLRWRFFPFVGSGKLFLLAILLAIFKTYGLTVFTRTIIGITAAKLTVAMMHSHTNTPRSYQLVLYIFLFFSVVAVEMVKETRITSTSEHAHIIYINWFIYEKTR